MRRNEQDAVAPVHQQRLDLALTTASIGSWEWDPAGDRVTWSDNFEELHGFERGAFGSSLLEYARNIHPDDRDRIMTALQTCAAGGANYRVEYRLIAGDDMHHVEASGCRVEDADGRAYVIGVCRDVSERVRLLESERAARQNAESSDLNYRTLAATIPQQVWTATPDGALDFVNDRVVDYFGRPAEDVIGTGWQDVIHPVDLPAVVQRWTRSLTSGDEYEVEFRLRRHDGKYRWHLGRAVPLRDASGKAIRWLGTNTDIDETKHMMALMSVQVAVARILLNARSLDEVADKLLEAVCRNLNWTCAQLWIVDRQEQVLRRSAGWCGQVPAVCDFEQLAAFDRLAFGTGLPGRIWSSKQPAWIEDVAIDPNFPRAGLLQKLGLRSAFGFPLIVGGDVTAVLELLSAEPRPHEPTTVKMAATFGNQVGQFIQRIAAEQDLSDALQRLRRLQSVTDAALSYLSLEDLVDNLAGKICAAVACDIAVVLLYDPRTGELYPASTFGAEKKLPAGLRIKLGDSLSGRAALERKTLTCRNASSDESIDPHILALGFESMIAVPLLSGERLTGVLLVGAVADRTFTRDEIAFVEVVAQRLTNAIDKSTLYEEAQASSRMKDRFLSMASHELKTPMTGILGWTAVLKNETDPEVRAEAIEWIEESARAQARLVEDLLDSTRIREGKINLEQSTVDLAEVVAAAARVVSSAAMDRNIRLDIKLPENEASVYGDRARLQQVVWNLLSNAIKFTPKGKSIVTTIEADDASASITVKDEGDGIAPEFLPHVFNAFEQDDKGRRAGGLGLGLHIVSKLVKMHGGTVEAHSAGRGSGASFTVRLPRHPSH